MTDKHLKARIDQCLRNAELSRCPRRKFGAMLIDPKTNSILSDGYNGPPRGEEGLCGGLFCAREGLSCDDVRVVDWRGRTSEERQAEDPLAGMDSEEFFLLVRDQGLNDPGAAAVSWRTATRRRADILKAYPPIKSGTRMDVGCHHAEANVLANAMRRGIATEGAWLIVTGEPCMMCAKYLHHGGIAKVFVVKGGYAGGDAGVKYLQKYGVEVEYVDGPQDPRTEVS